LDHPLHRSVNAWSTEYEQLLSYSPCLTVVR